MFINDRQITISVANSRKSTLWTPVRFYWSELVAKTAIPVRGTETHDIYMSMSKPQQDDLKDVGGFVAGALSGPRRKGSAVTGRDVIALDFDNIPAGGTDGILRALDGLGCGYCVYSTRKNYPAAPRLRVLFPLDRTATADEYEPCARRMATYVGIQYADPTTFEASRLMYWPSCSADSEYIYQYADRPMLSADGLLATYTDWHNMAEWPQVPGAAVNPARLAAKQGDPTTKTGIVGAFCRTYSVPEAMDKFLPGVYEPVDNAQDRYTFTGGSTTGGAVVYDDGKFLYSHHATDPCGGKLVNAFDLVRLHKFDDLDDTDAVKEGTPVNRLPSYTAMCELAQSDEAVVEELARQRADDIQNAFGNFMNPDAGEELAKCEGKPLSADIVKKALEAFCIRIKLNQITGKVEVFGLPAVYSDENAANTLPIFLLDRLRAAGVKAVNKAAIIDYLAIICDENRYNPVVDMLESTTWDREERFPEILRILGVQSQSFSAMLVKKWLIQCVALAHNTLQKQEAAEGVLTLQGAEGIGKTRFFRRIAIFSAWFVEGKRLDMSNKDSILEVTGSWIAELGELNGTLKREQAELKAFITSPVDRIRAPYAREASFNPRRTSICATVNPEEFLQDETGDRRFWVVPVKEIDLEALNTLPNEWFMQLWAEIYLEWKEAPQSFRLSKVERQALCSANQKYRQPLSGEVELRQRLNFDLPKAQWGEFSASDLLMGARDKADSRQIGRVLAKLEREDQRITSRIKDGYRLYRLPIPAVFSVAPASKTGSE